MRRTIYSHARSRPSLSPATRTNGTANGVAVDINYQLANYRSAMLVVTTGTVTDGSHAITVQDSVDGSAGWVNLAADQLQGSPPTITGTDDDRTFDVGVVPNPARPFLRAVATTSGATTGGIFDAVFVLGQAASTPVSHA